MYRTDIEKSLKRYLKKKISFSLSLLVAFMITGGLSFGATEIVKEIKSDRAKLSKKVVSEKDNILKKIERNEIAIKQYNDDIFNLIEKADFYSKPVWESNQIFFTYNHIRNGRVKDNTNEQFSETIDALKKYREEHPIESSSNIYVIDKYPYSLRSGVPVLGSIFYETVELGASINPLKPEIPKINPNISVEGIYTPVAPTLNIPKNLSFAAPNLQEPGEVEVNTNFVMPSLNLTVNPIAPIESLNIEIAELETPDEVENQKPLSFNVETPKEYKDRIITEPEKPEIEVIKIDPIKMTRISVSSTPAGTATNFWLTRNGSIMSGVSFKSGEYNLGEEKVTVNKNGVDKEVNSLTIEAVGEGSEAVYNPVIYKDKIKNVKPEFYETSNIITQLPTPQNKQDIPLFVNNKKIIIEKENERLGINSWGKDSLNIFVDVPYVSVEKDVTINANTKNKYLFRDHYYRWGVLDRTLETLVKSNIISEEVKDKLYGYRDYVSNGNVATEENIVVNDGIINLLGEGNSFIWTASTGKNSQVVGGAYNGKWHGGRSQYLLNKGKINAKGDNSHAIIIEGRPYSSNMLLSVAANTPEGEIIVDGRKSAAITYYRRSSNYSFINEGIIKIRGDRSIAINTGQDDYTYGSFLDGLVLDIRKAIEISGDRAIGFNIGKYSIKNNKNMLKFDIGTIAPSGEKSNAEDKIFTDRENDPTLVERAIGIYSKTNYISQGNLDHGKYHSDTLTAAQINIGEYSYGGIGIYTTINSNANPTKIKKNLITILDKNSFINVTGGEKNIVLLADGGNIDFNGDTNIDGGKENKIALANYGTINFIGSNIKLANVVDTQVFAANANSKKNAKIIIDENSSLDIKALKSRGIIARNTGIVEIKVPANTDLKREITLTGEKSLGIYADKKGQVIIPNIKMKVDGGDGIAFADGTGTNINLSGAELTYKGDKYALYAKDSGKIDASNAKLILDGKAIGFKLDKTKATQDINLTGTTIKVLSNDVTIGDVKLKNTDTLNLSTLKANLKTILGVQNIDDTVANGYKFAIVDGGKLDIDADMDITNTDVLSPGYKFYNRFIGRHMHYNVSDNINITAKKDGDQVVALALSSIDGATNRNETTINIRTGAKIQTGRIGGAGTGAIGAYINYGEISNNGSIEVEKDNHNEKAVGIYGVNGSKITNSGTIDVDGNSSIGILGMAFKKDNVAEFGNDGHVEISNTKDIITSGDGSIGIYAKNNNTANANSDFTVENNGNITVGANQSVGIYGEKVKITNNGNITVGDKSIGIYGSDGSEIVIAGTFTLGSSAEAIALDDTSTFTGTDITLVSAPNSKNAKGLTYRNVANPVSFDKTIHATNFANGSLIYTENTELTNALGNSLTVGKNGTGIFAKGNSVTNAGTINLTDGGIALYGDELNGNKVILDNTGTINISGAEGMGIYVKNGGTIKNSGDINLNANAIRGIGIVLEKGSSTNITADKIHLNGEEQTAVFAIGSTVNINENINFAKENQTKSTYLYGRDGSTITIKNDKTLTVDGTTTANTKNKTIGIFLENKTAENNFTGKLDIKGKGIGVYSKGENNINIDSSEISGDSIGVYANGSTNVEGDVDITTGTGIYGKGGRITLKNSPTYTLNSENSTGMYLTEGASVGGTININNTDTTNNTTNKNIGLYFDEGISTNEAEINLTGTNSIGIYVADRAKVSNNQGITSTTDNNIGVFVSEGGSFTSLDSTKTISLKGVDSYGIYANKGSVTNEQNINVTEVGIIGDGAKITNTGNITSKNIGIYGKANSKVVNTGNITAEKVGAYIDDSNFNNEKGSITVNGGLGLALKNTSKGTIKPGTINVSTIGTDMGIGIYTDNSKIDFVSTINGDNIIGVIAKNQTDIQNNVSVTGKGSKALYIDDDSVKIGKNISITTGVNGTSATSVGVVIKNEGTYNLENINIDAKNGVGLFLSATPQTGATNKKEVTFSGNIKTDSGTGIYIGKDSTLTTGVASIDIANGGTGIYIKDGTANLGQNKDLDINFENGGTGIFVDGGTITLGDKIHKNGTGNLILLKNSGIESTKNIEANNSTGLFGVYDNGLTENKELKNIATINVTNGGTGIVAIKGTTDPTHNVIINNENIINVSGKVVTGGVEKNSVGIYSDVAEIKNTGTINVLEDGIGIYANSTGKDITSKKINLNGNSALGIFAKGNIGTLDQKSITGNGVSSKGIILENIESANINLGNINLTGESSVGTYIKNNTQDLAVDGNIEVGKKGTGIIVESPNKVTINGSIDAHEEGIGIYGNNSNFTVPDITKISVGTNGTFIASENSSFDFTGTMSVTNKKTGMLLKGGTILNDVNVSVSGSGTGVYVDTTDVTGIDKVKINLQAGNQGTYTVGAYYKDVNGISKNPVITQNGENSIAYILENSNSGTRHSFGDLTLTKNNQIGIKADNSTFTVNNINQNGDNKNYSIFASKGSNVKVAGTIDVMNSNNSDKSIGVVLDNSSFVGNNGKLTVGSSNIGIYARNMNNKNIVLNSDMDIKSGSKTVGIYGEGNGDIILTGNSKLLDSAIGIYSKGMDISANGNMEVGKDTSVGIISSGDGDVNFQGNMKIADKGDTGSIGIYKFEGENHSNVNIGAGNWNVGKYSYGLYMTKAKNPTNQVTATSSATINLGDAAVAFASRGNNEIRNGGTVNVGKSVERNENGNIKYDNSVGFYLVGGSKGINSGIMNVEHNKSIGIYGDGTDGNVSFVNDTTGIIKVDNGGIGILVKEGAEGINRGHIEVRGEDSIGMASYSRATITNDTTGVIEVFDGTGMLKGMNSTLVNKGRIILHKGVGIEGVDETYANSIELAPGADSSAKQVIASTVKPEIEVGSIKISSTDNGGSGSITIDGKYITEIGATFETKEYDINLLKPVVSIANYENIKSEDYYIDKGITNIPNKMPIFSAKSIEGKIVILPDFANVGNGITYKVENFMNSAGQIADEKITPIISPMFIGKITDDGDLLIAKRPYADITIGEQFDELDKGLDSVLNGVGKDKEILMSMNKHLGEIFQKENEGNTGDEQTIEYQKALGKYQSEMRGDIYANIQDRIQNINSAFDFSFNELVSSYNNTRDVNKYSVMYTDGDYKNDTLGVMDYDYKVRGLLYMHEEEGLGFGNKFGYTLGFANTRFDFDKDDGNDSKEKVYSLRAGVHENRVLDSEKHISLLSRVGIGYNRHKTTRNIVLDNTYTNVAKYNTYVVEFDNKVEKRLYRDFASDLSLYGKVNLEYGYIEHFRERGNLALKVQDNDYFSAVTGVGINGEHKFYTKDDYVIKTNFNTEYSYELGNNYKGNEAKLKNTSTGYYDLITPEKKKGAISGTLGIGVEKVNQYGVNFEVTVKDESNKTGTDLNYGIRFNYKF